MSAICRGYSHLLGNLVQRVGTLRSRANVDGVVGDGGHAGSAGGLSKSIRSASTTKGETGNDSNDNTHNGTGSEGGANDELLIAALSLSEATEALLTVVNTAVVAFGVSARVLFANDRVVEAAMEGVTGIVSAEIAILLTSLEFVHTTNSGVAGVHSTHVVVVAVIREVGNEVDVFAASGGEARVLSTSVVVVAGNLSPLAVVIDALVSGASILIITVAGKGTLGDVLAEKLSVALSGGGDTPIGEAVRVGLAGNIRGDTLLEGLVALILLAKVASGVVALAGLLAAAGGAVRDSVNLTEVIAIAGGGGLTNTAHAEATAATAGGNVLLAGTSHELKVIVSEISEVLTAENTLGVVVRHNEELVHGHIAVSTHTDCVNDNVRDLGLSVGNSIAEVASAGGRVAVATVTSVIVVVVTISDYHQHVSGRGAAFSHVVGTEADTRRHGGTAAAARVGMVRVVAALEVIHTSDNILVGDTLSEGESRPGLLVEVHNGEGGVEGTVGELLSEALHEALLVLELSGGDGARTVKDHDEIHRLTTAAVDGSVEALTLEGAVRGEGELSEIIEDKGADLGAIMVHVSDIHGAVDYAGVVLALTASDVHGVASTLELRAVRVELGHGIVEGTGLTLARLTILVDPLVEEGLVRLCVTATRVVLKELKVALHSKLVADSARAPAVVHGTIDSAALHEGVA
jgi:hypothetical protein